MKNFMYISRYTFLMLWIWVTIGSSIGSFIPTLWGASFLSFSSVLLGGIGAFAGIWFNYKLTR
jgi:hypothetical protein